MKIMIQHSEFNEQKMKLFGIEYTREKKTTEAYETGYEWNEIMQFRVGSKLSQVVKCLALGCV